MSHPPDEMSAAEFKARCLKLMDQVHQQRTELVITKRGKPIAKLVPLNDQPPAVFGFMRGTALILGDVESPLETPWDTLADG
jgi:prevent-host-death family protein